MMVRNNVSDKVSAVSRATYPQLRLWMSRWSESCALYGAVATG